MAEHPLKIFEKLDPELLNLVANTRELALADSALPKRIKLVIAIALDASHGAVQSVKALAQAATQAGATKEEITEALRVAQYVSGLGAFTQPPLFSGNYFSPTVCESDQYR